MLRIILLFALSSSAISAEESYPAGTLTETVDLDLQPVDVEVPETFRDRVPEGLTLNLPKGFPVSIFAVNFRRPRFMAFDANDVLHVADMGARTIVALPDRDGDGVADEHVVAASGFREAHSLAFHDGAMYVADTDAIIRLDDGDGNIQSQRRAKARVECRRAARRVGLPQRRAGRRREAELDAARRQLQDEGAARGVDVRLAVGRPRHQARRLCQRRRVVALACESRRAVGTHSTHGRG